MIFLYHITIIITITIINYRHHIPFPRVKRENASKCCVMPFTQMSARQHGINLPSLDGYCDPPAPVFWRHNHWVQQWNCSYNVAVWNERLRQELNTRHSLHTQSGLFLNKQVFVTSGQQIQVVRGTKRDGCSKKTAFACRLGTQCPIDPNSSVICRTLWIFPPSFQPFP